MISLSLSRTCVSNQAAIESSSSIIGTSASLCVTKQSISSLSLQIEFISSEPVECSFLRVLQVVSGPLFRQLLSFHLSHLSFYSEKKKKFFFNISLNPGPSLPSIKKKKRERSNQKRKKEKFSKVFDCGLVVEE